MILFLFTCRIAKKMLLAQIKSNYSSGAESSSDNEEAEKEEKSSKKVKKENEEDEQQGRNLLNNPRILFIFLIILIFMNIFKTNFSFHEDDEDTEDSGSDVEVKKSGRRHKLLRHKLSLSEGESGEEKAAGKEKKKGKKKSGRKGLL